MNTSAYVPDTESRNPASLRIDEADTAEMLSIINSEDKKVAFAVEKALGSIALAVEAAEKTIRGGGRVVYIGAGTSGRLGVLDASECPPTYSVPPGLFTGIIAGGTGALTHSSEGMEDDPHQGVRDLKAIGFSGNDMLVGLAASGRTPYVLGALAHARALGAVTACVVCSKASPMQAASDIAVVVDTGPEAITGSTRMKAGTAQKMVLNMLSTGTMVRLGKVYGNLMVDMKPSNTKLEARALRMICQAAGCAEAEAATALQQASGSMKTAIVMLKKDLPPLQAQQLLDAADGHLKRALGEA